MWEEILSKYESSYGRDSMIRVRGLLTETPQERRQRHSLQTGARYIMRNLSSRMIVPVEEYQPLLKARDRFEKDHSRIRSEILNYLENVGRPELNARYRKTGGDKWRYVFLTRRGIEDVKISLFFPVTMKYLREMADILFPSAGVTFSILEPGGYIPPHCDLTNVFIHLHQGVLTPDECGLKVGNSEISFKEKQTFLFDPSFLHEAWNRSTSIRIHLLLPIWHPGITVPERDVLTEVFKMLRNSV